jgi:hypothetical protein
MVGSDRVRNDLTRITEALQTQHVCWNVHPLAIPRSEASNNLAIPFKV